MIKKTVLLFLVLLVPALLISCAGSVESDSLKAKYMERSCSVSSDFECNLASLSVSVDGELSLVFKYVGTEEITFGTGYAQVGGEDVSFGVVSYPNDENVYAFVSGDEFKVALSLENARGNELAFEIPYSVDSTGEQEYISGNFFVP